MYYFLLLFNQIIWYTEDRTVTRAISVRPLTAEARVRVRVTPYGICGKQSGPGTGFFS
jgi:hypothetical protein